MSYKFRIAGIDFEGFMAFLLDRGAVPDIKGLHTLRVSGLWTPTWTIMLLSPDTLDNVSKVSASNCSDGVLSLTLHWNSAWDQRDPSHLSPGWRRLHLSVELNETHRDALEKQPPHPRPTSTRFRLGHVDSSVSIAHAVWEHKNNPLASSPSLDHVRSGPASNWTPSLVLALGLSRSLPLYHHHLDHQLTGLATHDTNPCGILVILGLVDESEAPPWEMKHDPNGRILINHLSFAAKSRAVQDEMTMRPEQADTARRKRQAEGIRQFGRRSTR